MNKNKLNLSNKFNKNNNKDNKNTLKLYKIEGKDLSVHQKLLYDIQNFNSLNSKNTERYVNKLTTPVLVENEYVMNALDKALPHIKHTCPEVLNVESDAGRKMPLRNALNKHPISHHIRAEMENKVLVETVPMKNDYIEMDVPEEPVYETIDQGDRIEKVQINDGETKLNHLKIPHPIRPVLDINSTRLINANYVDAILAPVEEGADHERKRKVAETITERSRLYERYYIEQFEGHFKEGLQLRQFTNNYVPWFIEMNFQQFTNNFNQFNPRKGGNRADTLVILTDVIYYITDDDLYALSDKLNPGVNYIGCMHVPKYFDLQDHPIIFDDGTTAKIEGKMKLVPESKKLDQAYYKIDDVKMIMEMDGNDHTYEHKVRFPQLSKMKTWVLNSARHRDYHLRVTVQERVDCGATYYISFNITKEIGNYVHDYITLDIVKEVGELQPLRHFMIIENQDKTGNLAKKFYKEAKIKDVKIYNDEYTHITTKNIDKNGKEVIINIPNPIKQLKIKQAKTSSHIVKNNERNYYVVRNNDGLAETSAIFKRNLKELKDRYTVTPLDNTLINKITTRLAMAQVIDGQFIRSLVGFVNRENNTLPIDSVISLISKCVFDTLKFEIDVQLIKDANLTLLVNMAKANQLTTVPDNLIESLFTGNLTNYIRIKIQKNVLGDKTEANMSKIGGSFTWNPFQ